MKEKTVMILSIDSKTQDGKSIIDLIKHYPKGWIRAEWVARDDYDPTKKADELIEHIYGATNDQKIINLIEAYRN